MQNLTDLVKNELWLETSAKCDQLISTDQADENVLFYKALASLKLEDYVSALEYGKAAFDRAPQVREIANFMAVLSAKTGQMQDSYFFAKVTYTAESSPLLAPAVEAIPDLDYTDALSATVENPLIMRGAQAYNAGDISKAENLFRQHSLLNPKDPTGYHILVDCLISEGRIRAASEQLRAALHQLPTNAHLQMRLGILLCQLGEFYAGRGCMKHSLHLDSENSTTLLQYCIANLHDISMSPNDYLATIQHWAEQFSLDDYSNESIAATPKEKLTVAWIVSGSDQVRFAPAISKVLAKRDKHKFHFIGFGTGKLLDEVNTSYRKAFDQWQTITLDDPYTLADSLIGHDVDIIINCGGYNAPELLKLFGSRIAPLQLTLNAPPLAGFDHLDAQISDTFILAPEQSLKLKHGSTYLVTEQTQENAELEVNRSITDIFTYGSDATLADLSPETVETWARLLKQTDNSMLLLRNHDFEVEENSKRLISAFGNFGLAHRIDIIATETSSEFLQEVDTYLVPFRTMNNETVADALSAGVPCVFHAGHDGITGCVQSVASNSSFVSQMRADTNDEYITKALDWFNTTQRDNNLRSKIATDFLQGPQFNTEMRIKDLEDTILQAWEKVCK